MTSRVQIFYNFSENVCFVDICVIKLAVMTNYVFPASKWKHGGYLEPILRGRLAQGPSLIDISVSFPTTTMYYVHW